MEMCLMYLDANFQGAMWDVCDTRSMCAKETVEVDDWGTGERNLWWRYEFWLYSPRDDFLQEDDIEWEEWKRKFWDYQP